MLKNIAFLVIAIVAGIADAYLAASADSLFFVLLPLIAFALGYYSSWRLGLLCGFLLFVSYTFTLSVSILGFGSRNLYYPLPGIFAFITGGFSLPLIGTLAPLVKKSIRGIVPVITLVITVIVIGWCGYLSFIGYSYYYQVIIQSPENLYDLEIYLPAGTVSGEPYEELYNHVHEPPIELSRSGLTESFTLQIVDTEYGRMLKLMIPELENHGTSSNPRYVANIIWDAGAPHEIIRLMPKSDITEVNPVISGFEGPVKQRVKIVVERFNVPVKIASASRGNISITLYNRTDGSETINFGAYVNSYTYNERISPDKQTSYSIPTDNEWMFIPVEATYSMRMDIAGD